MCVCIINLLFARTSISIYLYILCAQQNVNDQRQTLRRIKY